MRLRVAYLSPLPPQRSGIADYSAELLPHLLRHLDVDLVAPDGSASSPELAGLRRVPLAALGPGLASGRYATALYQMGNHRDSHGWIYRALLDHPGVMVLHDAVLHHLLRDLYLGQGDPASFAEELRYACGRSGAAAGERLLASGVPPDPWGFPLFERAVDRSRAVLVLSEFVRQRVLLSRPLARVSVVRQHLSRVDGAGHRPPSRAAARAALGLGEAELVVASFGLVTPAKRPGVVLRAFARLRERRPQARLLLVGEVSPHFDFAAVFAPELRAGVTVTGRLEMPEFLRAMAACDVAVNLRYPTAGETSATLVRLLGLGKPVIVSRIGAFLEFPDACCPKVDLDASEEDLLLAYLETLLLDEPLRRQMGEIARHHVTLHHRIEDAAETYADVVRATVEQGWTAFDSAPPLARPAPDDVLSDLVQDLTTAAVDLGLRETDDDLLRALAETVAGADLDLP